MPPHIYSMIVVIIYISGNRFSIKKRSFCFKSFFKRNPFGYFVYTGNTNKNISTYAIYDSILYVFIISF